ncbi:hypothetical protein [Scytonema sp. PCC 10023]|uniref:hypothetical protein n=1 Tax=Scytonema sp. PCC 10023 TaxID=1680591 RepID=UPI0039C624C6
MARERRLNIRVSDYELLQLEQEAKRRGLAVSDVVRAWIAKLPAPKLLQLTIDD